MTGLAWHFVVNPRRLSDERLTKVGQWEYHNGPLVLCGSGLHASVRALDALAYAPGPYVRLVEVGGTVVHGADKLVCSRRRPLWMADATDTLRFFARQCALDVLHLWDAPAVVRDYLETGDESLQNAARVAAWSTANAVASTAAWSAARAAARNAVTDAAWSAWAAAKDAVMDASRAEQNTTLESLLMELAP